MMLTERSCGANDFAANIPTCSAAASILQIWPSHRYSNGPSEILCGDLGAGWASEGEESLLAGGANSEGRVETTRNERVGCEGGVDAAVGAVRQAASRVLSARVSDGAFFV